MGGRDVLAYITGVEHAALGIDEHVACAVAEILDSGQTSLLPARPPSP